uniref:Uncharacterized protein n=1 Tax=Avena sativa TaxID=4498 RepID=A0ACD5U943_AVESA
MSPSPPPAPATDEARAEEEEILLRLPPDDPGCLFRASVVCKAWRSLLTSSNFGSRYRKLHRIPPLLGFFQNHDTVRVWFEPSSPTSPFLPMHPDHRELFVLDCRHGLVLLRTPINNEREAAESLIVWDPIGRRQWEFPPPEFAAKILYDNAVVLCAADGCNHLDCHGGRFLVVYVGTEYSFANASVFSSETRSWSPVASCIPHEPNLEIAGFQPKVLVGNVLYFNCILGSIILRFDYIRLELSIIHGPGISMPETPTSYILKTEDGVLGCAIKQESSLRLWSMDTAPDGSVAWTQGRDIELGMSLVKHNVIGFADGIGVFYLRTDSGIFTVDFNSGRVKNTHPIIGFNAIPYTSFYTPDQVRAITLPSTMASSSENVEAAQDEEGDRWEEVGNGEEEGGQLEDQASQELFINGSKAFEERKFVSSVDFLCRSLELRVAHHGKLSPKCSDTYYRYGWALLRKAQARITSNLYQLIDLDLAWKMLHVARVILEKSPGSTREKVKIFVALAKVSMQREDIEYSFIACFKALAILERLAQPYYQHIMNLNKQICLTFEFHKSGDAKAISLWKSRIQNLKRANEALLADKGDDASGTEVCFEESSLARDIKFVTNILLSALEKKLEDLEQAISTPVSEASDEEYVGDDVRRAAYLTSSSQFSGSSDTMSTAETIGTTGSTGTDLEAAGRGIKRDSDEQIDAEPSPKRFAEDYPSAEGDSSNSTDGQSRNTEGDSSNSTDGQSGSTAQDGSVSE